MDKVVHFEIPAANVARAEKFYESALGWKTGEFPEMKYVWLMTTKTDKKMMPLEPGSINGGMMKRSGQLKSPIITVMVPNIDRAAEKVVSAGGKMVVKKMPVGDMGYSAYFKDTEGNVMGLWQNSKKS